MIKYQNLENNYLHSYKTAIFVDEKVCNLWSEKITPLSKKSSDTFKLPSNEKIKTRKQKQDLEDRLFQKGYSKDSAFIAIGGGVICDLIGYLASTFCRGVPLVLVPSTLVAMIDACIGGKNGVNTDFGKNLIGTIYEPSEVWIDQAFLSTLRFCQIQEGLIEMLKHGLIFDAVHFNEIISLNALKKSPTLDLIQTSIRIKQSFVWQDVRDRQRRQILNFGHTFAHALEKLSNYQISHGHAVAVGLLMESYISYLEKDLSMKSFEQIYEALMPIVQTISYKYYSIEDWEKTLIFDKKNKKGKIYTVRLTNIGQAILPRPILKQTLEKVLQWFNTDACICHR